MKLKAILRRSVGFTARWCWEILPKTVLIVVAGGLLADLYCEFIGVPKAGIEIIQGHFLRHGLLAEFGELRAGLLRGAEAREVVIWDGGTAGTKFAQASQIQLRWSPVTLLKGHLRPNLIAWDNLELFLPAPPQARAEPALAGARLSGRLRLHPDLVEILALDGDLAGLQIHVAGRLLQLKSFLATRQETLSPSRNSASHGRLNLMGWNSIYATLGPAAQHSLQQFFHLVLKQGVPQSDGMIDARLEIPLANLAASEAYGTFSLADFTLPPLEIRKIRARFALRHRDLQLRQLFLQIGGDQTATGDVSLDFARKRGAGRITGIIHPKTIFQLLGRPAPPQLAELHFNQPPEFVLEIDPSPLKLDALQARLTCRAKGMAYRDFEAARGEARVNVNGNRYQLARLTLENAQYRDLKLSQIGAAGTLTQNQLALSSLEFQLDPQAGETVTGSAMIDLDRREWETRLAGTLHPASLIKLRPGLPLAIESACRDFHFQNAPPRFTFTVERSPFTPAAWKGQAEMALADFQFRDLKLAQATNTIGFAPGAITSEHRFNLAPGDDQNMAISLKLNPATGRIQGKAAGRWYLDRLYRELHLPSIHILNQIALLGPPADFSLTLEESDLSPAQWTATGTVAVTQGRYETLELKTAQSGVRILPGILEFKDIDSVTAAGETLTGTVTIGLPAADVTISGTVTGNPRLAEVFIAQGRSRARFNRLWQDFVWAPATLPVFHLDEFRFINARGSNPWELTMLIRIETKGARYRELATDQITAELYLKLPGKLEIRNAQVRSPTLHADGSVRLEFEDLASCSFQFKAVSDPQMILRTINPAWENLFGASRFAPDTEIDCEGAFLLGQESRTRLQGRLHAATCSWKQLRLEELNARWRLDDNRLTFAPASATLFGGRILGTGSFDFGLASGLLNLSLDNVAMNELAGSVSALKTTPAEGLLSGNCRLDLLRLNPDTPLQLNGSGRLWITEGDLWNLPFLNKLGEIAGFTTLGRITRLDADLNFAGDHLAVPEFHTDGTLLSLRGTGTYRWETEKIDFKVRGEALKTTRVIPFLLKPLFWFFEADLTGTVGDHHWRLIRNLREFWK